jgi:putative ABC transport system permease protein
MKFFKLIRRNVFRNKLRALLTAVLIAAIFFFVATLLSILYAFDNYSDAGKGYNRLAVQSAISLATPLPYSHEGKIRQIPGIIDVCKLQWIGAYYKDQRNFFANFAVDHDHMATVFEDYVVDPNEFAAFKADRRGVLVGTELMQRFKWKLGDRITLTGQICPYNPELTIRGVYHHPVNVSALYYHMDYHQEMLGNPGQVGTFWLNVKDPNRMAAISQEIDAMFKNGEYPTETFTEKEFQKNFISMMGNIKLLFTSISACAIFMVVLLAAITMSMSARERVTEIAVLKAIGFTRGRLLTLMLVEFIVLTLFGGLAGGLAARFVFSYVDMAVKTSGFLPSFTVPTYVLGVCAGVSALVGLLAGGLPAFRASSMSVVDGLRRVV